MPAKKSEGEMCSKQVIIKNNEILIWWKTATLWPQPLYHALACVSFHVYHIQLVILATNVKQAHWDFSLIVCWHPP